VPSSWALTVAYEPGPGVSTPAACICSSRVVSEPNEPAPARLERLYDDRVVLASSFAPYGSYAPGSPSSSGAACRFEADLKADDGRRDSVLFGRSTSYDPGPGTCSSNASLCCAELEPKPAPLRLDRSTAFAALCSTLSLSLVSYAPGPTCPSVVPCSVLKRSALLRMVDTAEA